jgi:hypothetical protein
LAPPELYLRHYSIRSYGHFENKVVRGGLALRNHPGPARNGSKWRKWYQDYLRGDLPAVYAKLVYSPENYRDRRIK